MKTDYSCICAGVFPLFCSQSTLCLDSQQETTAFPDYSQIYTVAVFAYLFWFDVPSCFWVLLKVFQMAAHLRYKVNNYLALSGIEGVLHDSKRFLMTLSLTSGTGWWIIQWDSCLKHGHINGASAGCLQYAGFATKAWLSHSHYTLTGVNFKEVNEENKQKLFGEIYTAIDTLAFTFGNV